MVEEFIATPAGELWQEIPKYLSPDLAQEWICLAVLTATPEGLLLRFLDQRFANIDDAFAANKNVTESMGFAAIGKQEGQVILSFWDREINCDWAWTNDSWALTYFVDWNRRKEPFGLVKMKAQEALFALKRHIS